MVFLFYFIFTDFWFLFAVKKVNVVTTMKEMAVEGDSDHFSLQKVTFNY